MATTVKKTQKRATKKLAISKSVNSYAKAPFFVNKAKAMESMLKQHGLPKDLAQA
jgi:hypothetical protein